MMAEQRMAEQRKHQRVAVDGMSVDLSDGTGFCSGVVQDISQSGLCVADMTMRFGKNSGVFTVVAASGHRRFKLRVKPVWEESSGSTKRMGLEIREPSWAWLEYVWSLELQNTTCEKVAASLFRAS